MAIRFHLVSLLLLATLPLSAQTTSAPVPTLLGQGWGVDHVGVGVRDMAQAQHDFEQLGFKVGKVATFPEAVSIASSLSKKPATSNCSRSAKAQRSRKAFLR